MTERDVARIAAERLAERTGVERHDALVVIGSGWDGAADQLGEVVAELPSGELPGFRAPAAPGHRGLLRSCALDGLRVLVQLGRTHLYEGFGADAVGHGVRVAAAAGARVALLTNASGGLHDGVPVGTAALLVDHLNLTGASPLSGATFVDLTDAWSPRLRDTARSCDPTLVDAVYAQLAGPSVQTVAETDMLRALGADLVGMSTVLDAIAARAAGLEVLGLSAVTTREGTGEPLDPDDVVRAAEEVAARAAPVLRHVLTHAVTP